MTIPNAPHDAGATRRALLVMTASATFFGLMAFAAKLASARLAGSQVAMIRFAVGLLPPLLIARWRAKAVTFKRVDLLLLRGFFGGMAVLMYFMAIEHIAVGVATLLNYTAPIFSGIFSLLFLREKISPKVLIPMPVALLGVYLVVRANGSNVSSAFGLWELVGIGSALCSGAAVTAMRAARQGENSWSIYTSFCLLGLFVTAPVGIAQWNNPTRDEWIALAATSLLAIGAQLYLTFSLRWVDAMTVGVISQLAVVISMILGTLFLGDRVTAFSIIGSALTIGGVVGVVYVTSLSKRVVATADEVAPES